MYYHKFFKSSFCFYFYHFLPHPSYSKENRKMNFLFFSCGPQSKEIFFDEWKGRDSVFFDVQLHGRPALKEAH